MVGQHRGINVTDVIHGQAPDVVILVFALLTQLGDGWFLFMLGGLLYTLGGMLPRLDIDRSQGVFVFGLMLAYATLSGLLKGFFQSPRPPGASDPPAIAWLPTFLEGIVAAITTAGGAGTGFPSGHALGATMVWGGIALVSDWGRLRHRLGLASAIIATVSFSRIVLGLHYVVDVLAGIAIGVGAILILSRLTAGGKKPVVVFVFAVLFGVGSLLIDASTDNLAAVGVAIGALLIWGGIADRVAPKPSTRLEATAALAIFSLAGLLFVGVYERAASGMIVVLGTSIAGGLAIAAPLVAERACQLAEATK